MVRAVSSTAQFNKIIKEAGSNLIVVKFTANWCAACQRLAPTFDKVAHATSGVTFVEVDADSNEDIMEKIGVTQLPTIVFIKSGESKHTIVGNGANAQEDKLLKTVAKYR